MVKIKLEKEVLIAKNKVRSLEDETKKHLNIHRWTKLEYSDPEKFELISQINSLQRRLNAKTEEVNKKEELIQEKEKLYIKLKHIVARQSGLDMEEPLSKYQAKRKEEGQPLKQLKEEIKSHQLEIRNYEYEIRRIVNDTEKLKQSWFKRMDEQGYDPNVINEAYEEEYNPEGENEENNQGEVDYENGEDPNEEDQNFQGENEEVAAGANNQRPAKFNSA